MAVDIDIIRRAIENTNFNINTNQIPFPSLAVLAESTSCGNSTQLLLKDGQTPFGDLLLAVFNSILEVFILCAAGYLLARHGILDKKTQKQINRLNVSLFTPALLFSKVAFFLTPAKLKELWVIPIWFVIVTSTSMVVGRVLGWAFGLRQSQRSFITAAAMFMNSNALPIALMQSLVVSVPDLAWGSDDNKNAMLGRALTYLTMYSTLGMVVRYSYGVSLLSRADTILVPPLSSSANANDNEERTPLLQGLEDEHEDEQLRTHASASTLVVSSSSKSLAPGFGPGFVKYARQGRATPSSSSSAYPSASSSPRIVDSPVPMHTSLPGEVDPASSVEASVVLLRPPVKRKNTTFYNSFPNSPNESRAELPTWADEESSETESGSGSEGGSESEGEVDVAQRDRDLENGRRPHHTHTKHHLSPFFHALHHAFHTIHHTLSRVLTAIHNFMTVPLWAALLSLFVASLDGVKHALVNHMRPVNEAVSMAGKCAVPVTLVVLGAYFYTPPVESRGAEGKDGANGATGGGKAKMSRADVQKAKKAEKRKRREMKKRGFVQQLRDFSPFVSSSSNANERAAAKTKDDLKKKATEKNKTKPGESKTVSLAVAARMIITPMMLIPLMVLATRADWHAVFEDPIFVVVNTILLCSPPALTLAQITAAASSDAFERLISRTIFWSYCVVTPVVMMGSVLIGLWLAKL